MCFRFNPLDLTPSGSAGLQLSHAYLSGFQEAAKAPYEKIKARRLQDRPIDEQAVAPSNQHLTRHTTNAAVKTRFSAITI